MDREAWRAIGHGIAKSRTRMSDYTARSFLQPPVFPAEAWGPHPADAEVWVESDAPLNVHIKWLREKIENDPKNPEHILTVWGVGYRFE